MGGSGCEPSRSRLIHITHGAGSLSRTCRRLRHCLLLGMFRRGDRPGFCGRNLPRCGCYTLRGARLAVIVGWAPPTVPWREGSRRWAYPTLRGSLGATQSMKRSPFNPQSARETIQPGPFSSLLEAFRAPWSGSPRRRGDHYNPRFSPPPHHQGKARHKRDSLFPSPD
jgi:hypothetical protein